MAEYISNNYPDSIVLDGLDDTIIGVSTAGNVIYSVERIIDVFISRDNMTPEEATEYFDYNVERALPHMTDGVPPILMNKIPVWAETNNPENRCFIVNYWGLSIIYPCNN